MTGHFLIRPLGPEDAAAYREVRLEGLRQAPEAFGSSFEEESVLTLDQFRARIPDGVRSIQFGAFSGERLVGLAGFFANERLKKRHIGTLVGVYVRPEARGTGLAVRLVQAVIAHARQHVISLQATVGVANSAAKRVYYGLGFKPYGVEAKGLRVGDSFHDEEMIALDLENMT